MIVEYSEAAGVSLMEAEDFRGFKLRLRASEPARPDIPGIVFVDDANVLIDIDAVPRLPGAPGTPEWNAGFRAMIDHAATRGWIDADSNAIRAHVEHTP